MDGAVMDYSLISLSFPFSNLSADVMNRAVRVKESVRGVLKEKFSGSVNAVPTEEANVKVDESVESVGLSLEEKVKGLFAQGKLTSESNKVVLWTGGLIERAKKGFESNFGSLFAPVAEDAVESVPSSWSELSFDATSSLMEKQGVETPVNETVVESTLEPTVEVANETLAEPSELVMPTFDPGVLQGIQDKVAAIGAHNSQVEQSFVPEPQNLSVGEVPSVSEMAPLPVPAVEENAKVEEDSTVPFSVPDMAINANDSIEAQVADIAPSEVEIGGKELTQADVFAKAYKVAAMLKKEREQNRNNKLKVEQLSAELLELKEAIASYEKVVVQKNAKIDELNKLISELNTRLTEAEAKYEKERTTLLAKIDEQQTEIERTVVMYEEVIQEADAKHTEEMTASEKEHKKAILALRTAYEGNMANAYKTLADTLDSADSEEKPRKKAA